MFRINALLKWTDGWLKTVDEAWLKIDPDFDFDDDTDM
jgi:hypothetical protein